MFESLLSIALIILACLYVAVVALLLPYLLFYCLFRITANLEQIAAYCEWHARVEQKRFEKQFPDDVKRSEPR